MSIASALLTERERAMVAAGRARRPAPRRRRGRSREHGYVAVATALLMIVMLLMVALGIDTAIYFTSARQLQRTADAAALAGVTKMPKFSDAKSIAIETAGNNRVETTNVAVEQVADSPRSLRVSVRKSVPSFFGTLIRPSTEIERHAVAEYVPAVELGSRLNSIGTGDRTEYGAPQGFWLAISGYCAPKEAGDRFAGAFEANTTPYPGGWSRCTTGDGISTKNNDFVGENQPSYNYAITIPCPDASDPCTTLTTTPYEIEVFNPKFDRGNTGIDRTLVDWTLSEHETWQFDNTSVASFYQLLDDEGVLVPGSQMWFWSCGGQSDDCNWFGGGNDTWNPYFTIPAGSKAGRYHLQIMTPAWWNSYGSNAFALGVHAQGAPRICTGPTCPTIAGETSMGVFANISGSADFYLAKLSPARYYRGKKIRVSLWDPGEGATGIQILAPTNNPAPNDYVPTPFTYGEADPGLENVTGFTPWRVATPTSLLDVSGKYADMPSHPPPFDPAQRVGTDRYNGRLVQLDLQIPADYGCASPTPPCVETPVPQDGWFKIRYITAGSDVQDRTTWDVQIVGDPVHLVHD